MWRLWSDKIQLKWMKNIAFDSAETYASLCQLQITLPGLLVSKNLSTHAKKWFSDFKQNSSVLRISVLSVKLFYLYCLFELKYCNYGLGRLKFNTEKNFAWVSINYTHVYTVSIQNKTAPTIDCLPTHRLLSVFLAWGRKISKLYYQTFPQKNRCSEIWQGKQSALPPNLFKKQAICMRVPPQKLIFLPIWYYRCSWGVN